MHQHSKLFVTATMVLSVVSFNASIAEAQSTNELMSSFCKGALLGAEITGDYSSVPPVCLQGSPQPYRPYTPKPSASCTNRVNLCMDRCDRIPPSAYMELNRCARSCAAIRNSCYSQQDLLPGDEAIAASCQVIP